VAPGPAQRSRRRPEHPRLPAGEHGQRLRHGGGSAGFLFCAAITVKGGAATARTLWSDTGTNTGYRLQINSSNQLELFAGNGVAFTSVASAVTLDVGGTYVVTAWDDGTNLNVQINKGAVASIARPAVSAGTAAFTLGKNNGVASGFFIGRTYAATYRQTDAGNTLRAQLQTYHAAKAGMTL
jgi:hypothetical protein